MIFLYLLVSCLPWWLLYSGNSRQHSLLPLLHGEKWACARKCDTCTFEWQENAGHKLLLFWSLKGVRTIAALFSFTPVYSYSHKDQIMIILGKQNCILILNFGIKKVLGTNALSSWRLGLSTGLFWKLCESFPKQFNKTPFLIFLRRVSLIVTYEKGW